jgi:hypothetical protein
MWIDVPDPEVRIEFTWMNTAGVDGREVYTEASQVSRLEASLCFVVSEHKKASQSQKGSRGLLRL